MSASFLEIRPADRLDLEAVVRDVLARYARRVADGLRAELDRHPHLVDADSRARLVNARIGEFTARHFASELVDILGNRGWEVLSPERATAVRKMLKEINDIRDVVTGVVEAVADSGEDTLR